VRPSGTFAGSSHTTLCARHRPISDQTITYTCGTGPFGHAFQEFVWIAIATTRRSLDLREISQQALAKASKAAYEYEANTR
jgi:hypothetical protein